MACIMADAALDPSSNTPPAIMEDCRKKVRREVTRGLSENTRDHKTAMDAGGAASIAEFNTWLQSVTAGPTERHSLSP
jgi:hypothetical protein